MGNKRTHIRRSHRSWQDNVRLRIHCFTEQKKIVNSIGNALLSSSTCMKSTTQSATFRSQQRFNRGPESSGRSHITQHAWAKGLQDRDNCIPESRRVHCSIGILMERNVVKEQRSTRRNRKIKS